MQVLPERFGKYHVLGLIARGGMAEIYKVKTVGIAGFEKVQALKRIHPAYASQPRFIRSFIDEARIAVELNHRNIVQVFDFGKAEGDLYLAMELIDGVDLRTAIRDAANARVDLPIALSCYILGEVGAGLDYAHRKKDASGRPLDIVHCDVSPQNIALSREGFVKILDFGIARAHIGTVSGSRRLRGKPRYMAPEQARAEKPTAATDVFALGIIAWELMIGRPLFDGRDLSEILAAVRRAEVPPPSSINPDVPAELSAAITRALSVDPAARGTAAELSIQLQQGARTLRAGVGSRQLADWLTSVYPLTEEETATVTAVEIPVAPTEHTVNTATQTIAGGRLEPFDDAPAAGPLVALSDKRRVVPIALLISGDHPAARRELSRMLADLAYKRGGVVYDQSDDELIVVYGLEVAGEDNVSLAMGYAVDAVELAREASSVTAGELTLRIAARANTVARRTEDGYHLVGDAVDEARALAHDADPGRPLLSGGTGRVTSAYWAFRELPARRHRRRRLRVLELLGPQSFDERDRALRGRRGRFFGRTAELDRITEALARAVADDCRVSVTLCGPPGVGKSRLIAELVARATGAPGEEPFLIAVAATPNVSLAPFALIVELFQASLNLPPGRGESARAALGQRLRHILDASGQDRAEVDEAIAAIDLAMELRDGAAPSSPRLSADLRERVTAALRSFRRAVLHQDRPLITVVEDLHLADAASAEVLRNTLRPPPERHAELLLMSTRDPTGPVPADDYNLQLELADLPPTSRRDLIRDRLADDDADDEVVDAVARRAGGNPLFIEELCHAVRELGHGEIPASAREVVVSRVDRLPASARVALQYAAVIGRNFRARILEELLGAPLHDELTVLFDEGLITRTDPGDPDAGDGELAFTHDLFQEVVYQSLSATARRDTHAALGRLLASRYQAGRDEPPATIAHHLERGGLEPAAAAYWLRAGRLALAAFDARAALAYFDRTLAIEETPADEGGRAAAKARRREALLGRERAHATIGDHAASARDLDRLIELAAGLPRVMADVTCRLAEHRLRMGNYAAAVLASETAEAAAANAGDERLRGEALRLRAEAFERQGRFDQAVEVLQRALAIFRRIGAAQEETRAMIGRGRIHLIRAQYPEARAAYGPILERVEEAGDPWLERIAHNHLAVIELCLGELESAMASARRAVELCQSLGDRAREGDNLSVCGIILMSAGRYREAADQFERALAIHEQTGSRWSRADCLVYAGETSARLGDVDRGLARIEEAIEIARDIGAKYIEANALNALAAALLSRATGPGDDVDRALEAATRATMTAREASLVGPEIQGLSRQAQAIWRAGYLDAALALSTRAVRLLRRQHHVEGSEEEILYTHFELLDQAGSDDADRLLADAFAGFQRKLKTIEDPSWRRSFAGDVDLHVALQRAARGRVSD